MQWMSLIALYFPSWPKLIAKSQMSGFRVSWPIISMNSLKLYSQGYSIYWNLRMKTGNQGAISMKTKNL